MDQLRRLIVIVSVSLFGIFSLIFSYFFVPSFDTSLSLLEVENTSDRFLLGSEYEDICDRCRSNLENDSKLECINGKKLFVEPDYFPVEGCYCPSAPKCMD